MKSLISVVSGMLIAFSVSAADVSMAVPGAKDFNGAASFQIIADVLDMESVPKQGKSGLLLNDTVRKDFDVLKATIKAGGK